MHAGPITSYIDVAQLTLYAFWIFFFGLIYWLRREDKREGYPLESDHVGVVVQGFPSIPAPKTFLLPHGGVRTAPRFEPPVPVLHAVPAARFLGAPLDPTGNPLVDGIGPAAYAMRADEPDLTWDNAMHKVVPLRVAREFTLSAEDPDPRGMVVVGADGVVAGTVTDVWVDRSEVIFRYLEVTLTTPPGAPAGNAPAGDIAIAATGHAVLLPLTFSQFVARRRVKVRAIRAEQFAQVPALRSPDQVTLLEEDKIMGYYGGGQLYALPGRMGPVL